jgi:reverse gyrase
VCTSKFEVLLNGLNSGQFSKFSISGPKGVGKSLALAAIATLFRKDGKKCFLWSPRFFDCDGFPEYVVEVFGKHCVLIVYHSVLIVRSTVSVCNIIVQETLEMWQL